MDLFRLIYISEKIVDISLDQLFEMIEAGQRRNKKRGLTGALVLHDEMFLQVLEGDSYWVNYLFSRITQDKRHTNVRIISFKPIQERLFFEYDMRFIHQEFLEDINGLEDFDPKLNKYYQEEKLDRFIHLLSDLLIKSK